MVNIFFSTVFIVKLYRLSLLTLRRFEETKGLFLSGILRFVKHTAHKREFRKQLRYLVSAIRERPS